MDDRRVAPPDDAAAFADEVAGILASILADEFVGAYFVGSIALGGYVAGESDIDIVAVCRRPVDDDVRQAVVEQLLGATPHCPARGLEFTLYRVEVASSLPEQADFEVNVNGGPGMPRSVHLSPDGQPRFWYVLDRAVAHRSGIVISGPPPESCSPRSRGDCSWRCWASRCDGTERTRRHPSTRCSTPAGPGGSPPTTFSVPSSRAPNGPGDAGLPPSLIDAAVELRHGRPAHLDEGEVDRFLDHVERALAGAVST